MSAQLSVQLSVQLRAAGNSLTLAFPDGWLEHRPLTRFELEEEAAYLKAGGFSLGFAKCSIRSNQDKFGMGVVLLRMV